MEAQGFSFQNDFVKTFRQKFIVSFVNSSQFQTTPKYSQSPFNLKKALRTKAASLPLKSLSTKLTPCPRTTARVSCKAHRGTPLATTCSRERRPTGSSSRKETATDQASLTQETKSCRTGNARELLASKQR